MGIMKLRCIAVKKIASKVVLKVATMKEYKVTYTDIIHADIDKTWEFFSSPQNLRLITPSYLDFNIVSKHLTNKIHPGMHISYAVRPLFGIKTTWVTVIKEVEEKKMFVDEQEVGPYKKWHHRHHFKEIEEGVRMTDVVTYAIGFGIVGKLLHYFIIKKRVDDIFKYRKKRIKELFPHEKLK